jgi:hypothetical protein
MKFAGIAAAIAALMLSAGNVMAVPSGKTMEFAGPKGQSDLQWQGTRGQGLAMR